jgi:cytochrome c
MKIIKSLSIGVLALSTFAYSCGGGGGSQSTDSGSNPPAAATPTQANVSLEEKYKDDPVFIAGSAKSKEIGCTACHMVERKIVGPSYADVAAKYENTPENVELLTAHVINGNVGNWGEVPMPAHPHLAKEDVETVVKYVLLLKK